MVFKSPIMTFSSDEEARECLEYWKNKLFLNDWHIKLNYNAPQESFVTGLDSEGEIVFNYINRSAVIRIVSPDTSLLQDILVKFCAEKILVHELLHLKYNLFRITDVYDSKGSMEDVVANNLEHSEIEKMAKTLIMVRYGLDYDWFRNFDVVNNYGWKEENSGGNIK